MHSPKGLSSEFVGEAESDPAARDKILNSDEQLVFITPECIIINKTYRDIFLQLLIKTTCGISAS